MNPPIQFLKSHGLKVFLPLLLLTTACGEETSSAKQADASPVTTSETTAAKVVTPSNMFELPIVDEDPDTTPDPDTNGGSDEDDSPVVVTDPSATDVPEPAALAGLGIAAAGLVALKRKQAA